MLRWRNKQQQRNPAAPAAPPLATVKNLQSCIKYVPTLDQQAKTDTTKFIYDQLQNSSPEDFAKMLHEISDDMRKNGDVDKEGPRLFLCNIGGGHLHILHSITAVPPISEAPSKDINQNSVFLRPENPYVMAVGNRASATDTWVVVPLPPKEILKKKKLKLGQWGPFPQPAANDTASIAATAAAQEFYPILPLVGKDMVQDAIDSLYPTQASLKMIAHKLSPHINNITDQPTREQAQRSLLS